MLRVSTTSSLNIMKLYCSSACVWSMCVNSAFLAVIVWLGGAADWTGLEISSNILLTFEYYISTGSLSDITLHNTRISSNKAKPSMWLRLDWLESPSLLCDESRRLKSNTQIAILLNENLMIMIQQTLSWDLWQREFQNNVETVAFDQTVFWKT